MTKASCIRVGHLVHNLVNEFEDVTVKLFAYCGSEEPPRSDERVQYHLVAGFDADKRKYYSWSGKLRADVGIVRRLIAQRRSIDVIHCHTIEGLGIALAFKACTFSSAPICMDVHGPVVPELVHYGLIPDWRPVLAIVTALERAMLSFVRHAFVSNDGLRQLMLERAPKCPVSVVYDYVDPAAFDTTRVDQSRISVLRRQYKPGSECLLTYVGMFKDYQGVDFLIRAFAVLSGRHPSLRLLLIGDGPCRADYQALIDANGLADRVHLPGLVPHRDVVNWLEISDIVVSPRIDNEITRAGFVSQMPEYMAAGKLIVATAVSGCSFLLRDGAGILVAPNDEQALVDGIEGALALGSEARRAMVDRAMRNVMQFTWQQGIVEVYRVYCELMGSDRT